MRFLKTNILKFTQSPPRFDKFQYDRPAPALYRGGAFDVLYLREIQGTQTVSILCFGSDGSQFTLQPNSNNMTQPNATNVQIRARYGQDTQLQNGRFYYVRLTVGDAVVFSEWFQFFERDGSEQAATFSFADDTNDVDIFQGNRNFYMTRQFDCLIGRGGIPATDILGESFETANGGIIPINRTVSDTVSVVLGEGRPFSLDTANSLIRWLKCRTITANVFAGQMKQVRVIGTPEIVPLGRDRAVINVTFVNDETVFDEYANRIAPPCTPATTDFPKLYPFPQPPFVPSVSQYYTDAYDANFYL